MYEINAYLYVFRSVTVIMRLVLCSATDNSRRFHMEYLLLRIGTIGRSLMPTAPVTNNRSLLLNITGDYLPFSHPRWPVSVNTQLPLTSSCEEKFKINVLRSFVRLKDKVRANNSLYHPISNNVDP